MIFTELRLKGAYVIDPERISDERGFFATTMTNDALAKRKLETNFIQGNMAYNHVRGTLRGMHFQAAPHEEVKLVRCVRGSIYDVIVDLRHDSPTFQQWVSVELTADNRRMLYVPRRFAHGYITLEDATEVHYLVSAMYAPNAQRGLRYDDPALNIKWPLEPTVVSVRDRQHKLLYELDQKP